MKGLRRYLLIIGVIITIIIGYFIINIPNIQGTISLNDRITIHLKVMLNGEEISLEDVIANCIHENKNVSVKSKKGIYKTKGGKYGEYSFTIIIPSERLGKYNNDITLKLKYINANSWYITESDCTVYLYSDKTGHMYADKAIISIERNDKTSENYDRNINIENNVIDIYWGI